MIKEKHEKGSDSVKEEPGSSDKETTSTEVRIKKEDEGTASNCTSTKKDSGRGVTKNGGIIGSTNTGSLQSAPERKAEGEETPTIPDATLNLKTEECIDNADLPADAFSLGLSTGPPHGAPPDGVQPLASNVINKQPGSMEVQYMQQQSQIFVFSTVLANTGADEVLQGRYQSIIAYHCAQPGTKKYLEKNPLKVTQFNRQNPAQWLNNLAMMKNKGCTRSPGLGVGPKSQASIENFLGPDGLEDIGLGDGDLPPWDHQKNNHHHHHHLEGLEGVSNGLPDGVKVPDENLTPQQRQHREVQLATIRKMQEMLFPENQGAMEGHHLQRQPSAIEMSHMIPPGGMMPNQMDWMKLQQCEDRKVKPPAASGPVSSGGNAGPRGGPRLQGPPPPYHQTPRSASVPIALQSPSPASPNNPTSNLSLPSPRASSALNSPADSNRQFSLGGRHVSTGQSPTSQDSPSAPRLNHSNPGTPVSSHLSPSVNSSSTEPTSTHQSSVDGMFGRTLQSMAQQKQQMNNTTTCAAGAPSVGAKEPNLMPVPSPQQIQYLNTFEGQELIIQKQPNTSLKERNIISPPILPTTLDSGFPGNPTDLPHNRMSGPNTPTSMDVGPRFPPTPGVPSEGCRFQIPSPHTPTATGDKCQRLTGPGPNSAPGLSPHPQTAPGPTSDPLKSDLFPTPSPHMMDVPRFPGPNASPGAKIGGGGFVNVSPSGPKGSVMEVNYACARDGNVPLNPNCTSAMSGNVKVSHFDPISSLAQMSQQLTNSVASSLNGQGNQGMINFGSPSMHIMEMGGCHGMGDMDPGPGPMMGMGMQGPPHGFHPNSPMGPIRSLSPKLPGAFPNHMPMPRMMGRPPGPPNHPYNGANVQVKPNAPNTIQYLPAKPQLGNVPGSRGPPSLDFLPRYANPLSNMDNKMPTQNLQYFPNNGPMQGGPMPPHMAHMVEGGPMQSPDGGPMGGMMGGPLGNGGPMMGAMGGMLPMMRGGPMRPPPSMMRMPQMGFNGPPGPGGPVDMFNPPPNMGNPNAQMFVGGPKGSPMGMAPDASQPLPPSMGQNNSFKNSTFLGPTIADPNYAQQFHNFQQQLYATSTRSQMGGQSMGPGPGPGPPHSQQPPYFNPK